MVLGTQQNHKPIRFTSYLSGHVSKPGVGLSKQPGAGPEAGGGAGLSGSEQPAGLRGCGVPKQTLKETRPGVSADGHGTRRAGPRRSHHAAGVGLAHGVGAAEGEAAARRGGGLTEGLEQAVGLRLVLTEQAARGRPEAAGRRYREERRDDQLVWTKPEPDPAAPLTCSKGRLVLPKGEVGVGGRGAEEPGGGAGCGRGCAEQTARPGCHRVGRAFPARLVVLEPQLLQGNRDRTTVQV